MTRKYEELLNRVMMLEYDVKYKDQQILNIKMILIDAGILVEVEHPSSTPIVFPIDNKIYTVRKVK